jgi:WD40 repeat protein
MSRIFLSHSSQNNDSAVALRDWLATQGWDDVFLDLDPQRGIAAGDRWERSLNQAALRCEAVLFLVSRTWLASDWCLKEFNLAHRLNKRLFGLLIEDIPISDLPATLTGTWQLVPLASGRDHIMLSAILPGSQDQVHVTFSREGLTRLRIGLERAGLDARFFAWPPENDPQRPPYRGLLPLESADAGIFFGREAPTIEALDRIRGMKDGAAPRLLVLLGASGAGKSSFLRAGLLPRLTRDDRNYVTLPVMRPERAAINGEAGLLRSLQQAFAAHGLVAPRAEIRAAIDRGAATLRPLLQTLIASVRTTLVADDANVSAPVLVLAIDQGEELFLTDGASESAALLNLLRELLADDAPALLVAITIRSDAYEQLQTAKPLEGLTQQTLSLTPMPRGAYQAVIEGPIGRLRQTDRPLVIEPALTQALLADIEDGGGRDALPLLAFTLERLYLEYGDRGRLTLGDYDALGRIKGSIEAAIERAFVAADADQRIPHDRDARLALLRRGLIPWLAGIDPDTGSPRRQKARLSEIPEEARPLIGLLVEQRLLSTDVADDTRERTIEPAHESLLRQWGSLQGWLQEDFAALTSLETVKRSSRDWIANARGEDWLSHRAGRLEDAERLLQRTDLAGKLDTTDRAYLAACRERGESDRKEKTAALERRLALQRRFSIGAVVTAVVVTVGGLYAYALKTKADAATALAQIARNETLVSQSRFLAQEANARTNNNDATAGALLAIEALSEDNFGAARPVTAEAVASLRRAMGQIRELAVLVGHSDSVRAGSFSPDGRRVLTASSDGTARIWNAEMGKVVSTLAGHAASVFAATFNMAGSKVVTCSEDGSIKLWDTDSGNSIGTLEKASDAVINCKFAPDGNISAVTKGGVIKRWSWQTGLVEVLFRETSGDLSSAVFNADGSRIVIVDSNATTRLINLSRHDPEIALEGHTSLVTSIAFSPDGKLVVTGSTDRTARVWDADSGKTLLVLEGHQAPVTSAKFSSDGKKLVTAAKDNTIRIWDSQTGNSTGILRAHADVISDVSFSADDRLLVSSSHDGTARIWSADPEDRDDVVIAGHRKPVFSIGYNIDGSRIATASGDGTVRIWSSLNGELQQKFSGHTGRVFSVAFSHDDRRIVTSSDDRTARIWDIRSGLSVAVLKSNGATVHNARFSPNDQRIATASSDGVRIWNANTGASISDFKVAEASSYASSVYKVLFTPPGDKVITAAEDGSLRIWDIQTGKIERTFAAGSTAPVFDIAISADGSKIVTASGDGIARLWETATGKQLLMLDEDYKPLLAVAMNSSATIAATGSWDGTVRLWDLQTGKAIADKRHSAAIFGLAFNPKGRQLALASRDTTARLLSLRSLGVSPSSVASAFGARFADLALQSSTMPEILDRSKAMIARCLTRAEREEVFLDPKQPSWCAVKGKWPAVSVAIGPEMPKAANPRHE